ncbi:MAG: ABC transporter substrate-binding protein [Deltaproteobacteria bacterium]|nr:ABC transporter substrate-binding protein [Deltaproteobacteria bacterium]
MGTRGALREQRAGRLPGARWGLSFAAVFLMGLVVGSGPAAGQPIKIGFIGELSGLLAQYGEDSLRAAELFVEQTNQRGGVLGRKVELIVRDDKTRPDEAVRHARDLIFAERVDFLVHSISSFACLGVSEVAKQARKLVFSSCAIDDFTIEKGHPYAFRIPNIITRTQGRAAAQYAATHFPQKKRYYLIGHDFSFGRRTIEFFKGKLRELVPGAEIVGEAWPKLGETNYAPYITSILNARPDVLMFVMATAIPFFTQAQPYGLTQKMEVLSAYWGGSDEMRILKREHLPVGAIVGGFPWYGMDNPLNRAFVADFKKKHGREPRTASYFISITLEFLTEAIRRAGTIETEKVIEKLEGMALETAVGKVTLRPGDHQGTTPHWMGKVQYDGRLGYGVLTSLVQVPAEQFLPGPAELQRIRQQAR